MHQIAIEILKPREDMYRQLANALPQHKDYYLDLAEKISKSIEALMG